jgi:integrase
MTSPMGAHGQGSKSQLANGRWRVAVTMADGTRRFRRARTEREADRALAELLVARAMDLDPTRQTLGDYLASWIAGLEGARNARIRPRTLEHYRLVVERHIVPALGTLRLSALTARRIQSWIDADPGAPRTVHHHHAVLRRALNVAVRQRVLAYNPALAVELPPVAGDVARPLTVADARALLAATEHDRMGPLWRLALVTGLRAGELLGLAWDDLEGDRVTVRHQLQRLDGAWARTPPKAARRVVTIALDAETAAVMERHRRAMTLERTPDWPYHGLVFTDDRGRPYHQADVGKAFHAACKRAGIAERRFHDLRHSSAHLLADAGVAEDTRQARLGHSTTSMARHYSGASEAQDREAAERLGAALG